MMIATIGNGMIIGNITGGTVATIEGIVTVSEVDLLDAILLLDEINSRVPQAQESTDASLKPAECQWSSNPAHATIPR
jgi:hypothetical protein